MCENTPKLKRGLERVMVTNYTDHWHTFIRQALRNIDYLSHNVSDHIIDEIEYQTDLINLPAGTEFIQSGKVCSEIHVI